MNKINNNTKLMKQLRLVRKSFGSDIVMHLYISNKEVILLDVARPRSDDLNFIEPDEDEGDTSKFDLHKNNRSIG